MRNAIIWAVVDTAFLVYWGIYFALINPNPSAVWLWIVSVVCALTLIMLVMNVVKIYVEILKRKTKKINDETEQIIRGRLEDKQTGEVVQITTAEQLRDILERKAREAMERSGHDKPPSNNGRLPF